MYVADDGMVMMMMMMMVMMRRRMDGSDDNDGHGVPMCGSSCGSGVRWEIV